MPLLVLHVSLAPAQLVMNEIMQSLSAVSELRVDVTNVDIDAAADADYGVREADLFGIEDQAPDGALSLGVERPF